MNAKRVQGLHIHKTYIDLQRWNVQKLLKKHEKRTGNTPRTGKLQHIISTDRDFYQGLLPYTMQLKEHSHVINQRKVSGLRLCCSQTSTEVLYIHQK